MAKQTDRLSDEDVLAKVLLKSRDAVGWVQQKLSNERERVQKYLNGEWPRRNSEGSSSYVSTDVYDSCRMQQAQLLEVFAGGDQIVQFDADQDMNAQECRVATEYARYVIFSENPGYQLFSDTIWDGLTARAGVAKVYWDEKYDYEEENFDGIDELTAHGIAAQEDVDEFDATQDPMTGLYSGTLIRKVDCSQVCIDIIAPEEFLIEPLARNIHTSTYVGHRTPKTRAQLIEMGYDKKLVMELPTDDAKELVFSPEVLARTNPTRAAETYDSAIQTELDYLIYYESFVRFQYQKSKGVRLYKVCHAGNKLLDEPEEVDKAPFIAYIPLPVPHTFFGDNYANRVVPTQNARTVLMRGILDHTAITTNPRWGVVNGGLMNPRELLDNRMGGIVNMRRPDSVVPLPVANLNPYIFQALQLLEESNEKSTGISALSSGLNKDAISTQNSAALVDNMMQAAGQRGKIMARNFAYDFLVPLMIEVIRLTILHVKQPKVIEVAGAPLQVNVQQWTDRSTCTVSQHLGYGEKDMAANKLIQSYQLLAKDPGIANMFGPPQRYAMLHDAAKLSGMVGFPNYLNPNAPPPQPQIDPIAKQEADAKTLTAQASMTGAQTASFKEQRLAVNDDKKEQLKAVDLHLKAMDHDRNNQRQDVDTAARIVQGQQEIQLQKAIAGKQHALAQTQAMNQHTQAMAAAKNKGASK